MYTSNVVSTTSPNNGAMVTQSGYTEDQYKAHTLTFSNDVSNAVMALWSLGSPSTSSTLVFTQPFVVLSSNGDLTSGQYSSGLYQGGYYLTGLEGNGVIQFLGTYSSISWTVTAPEVYSGFNIGLTLTNNAQAGQPQTVYSFPGSVVLPPTYGNAKPDILSTGNSSVNLASTILSGASANFNNRFNGGTLRVDQSPAGFYAGNFTITASGGTIDQGGYASTFTGVMSNDGADAGSLTVTNSGTAGTGSVTLQGVNTYTGATTVNAGAKLALSGSGSVATSSGVTANGVFDITATTSGASIKSLSGSGSVVTASNKSLTLTNAAGTFSGVISGAGGVNLSSGTETLAGANTYTGATTVTAGTLVVNGSLGNTSTTIGSSGTLMGTGTIGGTVGVSGTLAPGNSIGTLNFSQTLTLAGISDFEIDPTLGIGLNSDLANVTGAITYGGILNVLYGGSNASFTSGMVFNLFDGASFSGSFSTINLPDLTGTGLSWQNNLATNGTLTVVPEPAAALLGGIGLLALLRRRRG